MQNFEIKKDIYLNCINRTVNNYANNPRFCDFNALENLSKAQIYCADLQPIP